MSGPLSRAVPCPWFLTSDYVGENHARMGVDPGVVDLVCALLDTGVVATAYSCEGHFTLQYPGSFCHHNQKAQVRFHAKDVPRAAALCQEVLETVVLDGLRVRLTADQERGGPDDELEVTWCLEFRPEGFWAVRPQDEGALVTVAASWTEQKARRLLQKAFRETIKVCRKGRWRKQPPGPGGPG